ncbi:hypothetical protein M426DRAFT_21475 [Hypoxylon sp. CI-4A]|nr:hypothetical protein M426DRAFT_21475 [Hypoxylon sp. CI-4A]
MSHCWGQNKEKSPTTITAATLRARKRGLKSGETCPLFRDIFDPVKKLGYRYIWIDLLCIIHDEMDWQAESVKMAGIRAGSHLNIAVTYAPDSSHGLFVDRRLINDDPAGGPSGSLPVETFKLMATNERKSNIYIRQAQMIIHNYMTGNLWKNRELYAPLLGRAWVLQERLLVSRTIHFLLLELI